MKWSVDELEKYEGAKEYFDTLMIPLISLPLGQVGVEAAKEYKWLDEICNYSERQLTGRVLLLPVYYQFEQDFFVPALMNDDFRYKILITTNQTWYEKLQDNGISCYLINRKNDEENLAEIVKEGKKLTKAIMEHWKNEISE
ncbi:DUF2487 family protein [Ammoniphilus resinae]|uniref:DUF2487 family protein n=1 Tax=Ammoniphilus resinae TaxID=861532 RepID=A0ABS4GT06_9BACL|nr:DUF2487 family protein [Ammoniphilus resinae]MBP1933423.1 hypothetical protein [Ammoniphilus resinae]